MTPSEAAAAIEKPRYVRMYHDEDGRFLGDHDFSNRADAETFSTVDVEPVDEVVRLLSKEEEADLTRALREAYEAILKHWITWEDEQDIDSFDHCAHCGEIRQYNAAINEQDCNHKSNCIVLTAIQWLKENLKP